MSRPVSHRREALPTNWLFDQFGKITGKARRRTSTYRYLPPWRVLFLAGSLVAVILSIAVSTLPTYADTRSYNLDRTVSEALRTSDDLALAAKQLDIDQLQAGIAASRALPSISANVAATQYDGASKVLFSNSSPPIELLGTHAEDFWVGVVQPFDITGQVNASVRSARIQTAIDELAVQQLRIDIVLRSKRIYYDLLRAEHRVRVAQSAVDSATAQQLLITKLVAEEMGQKIDLRRADTQVANANQDLVRASADRDIARQYFNDLVGQSLDSDVVLEDVSGVADVAPPAASESLLFPTPQIDTSAGTMDADVEYARTHRPDLLSADLSQRASVVGVKLARSGLDPTVSLTASAHYTPTTSFMMPRNRTAEVSLQVTFPLYDGGATSDRIAQSKARVEQSDISLTKRRKTAELSVRQAFIHAASAAHQIDAANTALREAVAARRLAQARYEGQVGLYLEITDAQSSLVTAQNNQVNAVYDYLIAQAQLEYELGGMAGQSAQVGAVKSK